MQKRWVQQQTAAAGKVAELSAALRIDAVLAALLVQRGVETYDEARLFFRPDLSDLHDPFLMQDMKAAVTRMERALHNNEKILVYGDYDVDGTTAVAVVYSFFKQLHARVGFYVPDRYAEGYGVSRQGVEYARSHGYSLIIALDCGIKAIEQVLYADELGIDFIIGDHHMPGPELPAACAVLDPKRSDCAYPYKELTGCGIGFKLIQGFARNNAIAEADVFRYLDLVAVSIAADIVPVNGENRVLAYHGLQQLNSNPSVGLRALVELSAAKGSLTLNDIVFQIAPRINAAGRIKHAAEAIQLLTASSLHEAQQYSRPLNEHNILRKDVDLRITEEALAIIDGDEYMRKGKSTVVYKADWHKGVIGIVASRLTEKYYRPTVVLTQVNGHVTGSARSVEGFDLYEALSECDGLLDQFGGHKYAAGLTMKAENVPAFSQRFEEAVARRITPEMMIREIGIDACLRLSHIDERFFRILKQFEPFGPGNQAPVFLSCRVQVAGQAWMVGNNHLKLTVRQQDAAAFDCIAFGLGAYLSDINKGAPFDICYTIEENNWRSRKNIQLNIKGIRLVN